MPYSGNPEVPSTLCFYRINEELYFPQPLLFRNTFDLLKEKLYFYETSFAFGLLSQEFFNMFLPHHIHSYRISIFIRRLLLIWQMKDSYEHSGELKIMTNHRSPKRKWSCSWLWPRLTSRSRRLGYRYRRISVLSCLFTTDLMASIRGTRVLAAPCYHNSKRSRWKSRNSSTYTRDPARF